MPRGVKELGAGIVWVVVKWSVTNSLINSIIAQRIIDKGATPECWNLMQLCKGLTDYWESENLKAVKLRGCIPPDYGYADRSVKSTAKTPVRVNVGRTWLIILHHISRVKPIVKAHLGSEVQWRWEAYSFKLNIGATVQMFSRKSLSESELNGVWWTAY